MNMVMAMGRKRTPIRRKRNRNPVAVQPPFDMGLKESDCYAVTLRHVVIRNPVAVQPPFDRG